MKTVYKIYLKEDSKLCQGYDAERKCLYFAIFPRKKDALNYLRNIPKETIKSLYLIVKEKML